MKTIKRMFTMILIKFDFKLRYMIWLDTESIDSYHDYTIRRKNTFSRYCEKLFALRWLAFTACPFSPFHSYRNLIGPGGKTTWFETTCLATPGCAFKREPIRMLRPETFSQRFDQSEWTVSHAALKLSFPKPFWPIKMDNFKTDGVSSN